MRKTHSLFLFSLLILLAGFVTVPVFANNITVSGTKLTGRDKASKFVLVQFNLTWENAFKTSSGPINFDAAWVFVKYKVGDNGTWNHATLNNPTGHTFTGASTSQPDATGIFVYRSTDATGTFTITNAQLRWNYGTDAVSDDAKVYVKVFAIEMVNIPSGNFQVGSSGQNTGEFRQANDLSTGLATATTFTITGSAPTLQGNNSASSALNISTKAGSGNDQFTGTTTVALSGSFPTGVNSFYCMKYEITQGQYRDFLNTLTRSQQDTRTGTNLAAGVTSVTNRFVMSNSSSALNRNGIRCDATIHTSDPISFYCDLDGDGIKDESTDGEWIACNYLSWNDVAAFLDWAALRPMTELEYEKVARGTVTPVSNECAWGAAAFTAVSSITNGAREDEGSGTTGANVVGNNIYSTGPTRVGMFATASNNRTTAGASYYGVMDVSGNVWEQVVGIGNSNCRSFTGAVGNGAVNSSGDADVGNWPSAVNIGLRGGSYISSSTSLRVSDRSSMSAGGSSRLSDLGGRGVR